MTGLDAEELEFLAAARLLACRRQPYLSSALFSLVPVNRPGMGTFAVDRRWRLYIDMEVAREWGVENTAGVLVHEANHVLRNHHQRRDALGITDAVSAREWNLVADAAINDDLVAADIPLPDPVLAHHLDVDPAGTEETMWHQLHRARSAEPPADEHTCGSGSGGVPHPAELDDADTETPGISEDDAEAVRRDVAHRIAAGTDSTPPLGLSGWARDLLRPRINWKSQLAGAYRTASRPSTLTEPSWNRPSRRPSQNGVVTPGRRRVPAPNVTVVIDTSASMDVGLLDAAIAELNALIHHRGTRTLTVIPCDRVAHTPQQLRHIPDLAIKADGGTDLRAGICVAAEQTPRPDLIVTLTDGYTRWPTQAPPRTKLLAVVIDDEIELPSGPNIRAVRVSQHQ